MGVENIGKKAVRVANSIVNFAVLLVIVLLVAVALYALWDSEQVYHAADAAKYEVYKPRAQEEAGGPSFAQLVAINPEAFAWLTVYGTNIDYPVTQADDNAKYVNTNALGEYSLSGSIFLDYTNRADFTDFNSIFYGHHMEKRTMFGELGLFANEAYFNARAYGNLYYGKADHGLEFFAFLHVDAYDSEVFAPAVAGEQAQQAYLKRLLEKATFTRNIGEITPADRIVLLSTCSAQSTNGRDILVARLTDTLYDSSFENADVVEENISTTASVDRQDGFVKRIPGWVWLGLMAIALGLIGYAIYSLLKAEK